MSPPSSCSGLHQLHHLRRLMPQLPLTASSRASHSWHSPLSETCKDLNWSLYSPRLSEIPRKSGQNATMPVSTVVDQTVSQIRQDRCREGVDIGGRREAVLACSSFAGYSTLIRTSGKLHPINQVIAFYPRTAFQEFNVSLSSLLSSLLLHPSSTAHPQSCTCP